MILVLPFCNKDGGAAVANLGWIRELDPQVPFHCLLSHDDETSPLLVATMKELAEATFQKTSVMWYPAPQKKYWPAAANCAFQNAARYVAHFFQDQSWLFLEADATPIRSGWLGMLEAEHIRGGKPFSGHVVRGMGHPNGVAIYPPMVAMYSQQALQVEETAWDVVLGATVEPELIHNIGRGGLHLIQHCWNMHEETGEPTNGHGYMPTFKSAADMVRKVDLNAVLYHRCKDGSLIHWLREYYKNPAAAMVPDHTSHDTKTNTETKPISEAMEQIAQAPVAVVGRDENNRKPVPPFNGQCEIFIVTYGLPTERASHKIVSDFDWLAWCLRCIRRHCTGFAGITLAIPNRDAQLLVPIAEEHAKSGAAIPLRIKMFMEKAGKGFVMHEAVMASADEFVPHGTTHVLHVDADVMFKEAVTPAEYVHGTKPVYVVRSYASLQEPGTKVVSDCIQWLAPTRQQIGFEPEMYTMCRHPTAFPISFYKAYRDSVAHVQGKPFKDYMLSGRNEFPSDRMDFTAMGAWAYGKMRDSFEWIDISAGNHLAPRDKQQCYWSHGGITPHIQAEIEGFLK